jgi:lipoprotein LprG
MARRTRIRRAFRLMALSLVATTMWLTSCSGSSGPQGTPTQVLSAAKKSLDETSGVTLSLHTDKLPDGVDGILDAKGVATHAPAFDGDLTLVVNGLDIDVAVVSAGGKVYAQLPFTNHFSEVNPADYGAPDPAQLMDTGIGLSSWLTQATGVEKGDRVREGDTVLTAYDGSLAGSVVDSSISSADETAEFPVSFRIDDQGRLRSVRISGPFYGEDGEVDYSVGVDDYGTDRDIEAP